MSNKLVLDIGLPQVQLDKVSHEVLVDADELTSQDSPREDVCGVRLEALVVAKHLRSGGGGHGSNQKTVSSAIIHHLLLQVIPVVSLGDWLDVPKVELELALTEWTALEALVCSFFHGKFHRSLHRSVVNGLEDHCVDGLCLWVLKSNRHLHEAVGQPLDTNSNWSVLQVTVLSLLDRVVIHVNDPVQVGGDSLDDLVQLGVVELLCVQVGKRGEADGGQVTNSDLVLGGVLYDLSAEIRAFDGAQVLLVRLTIASVLVHHVRSTSFDLRVNDLVPKSHGFDRLSTFALLLILLI